MEATCTAHLPSSHRHAEHPAHKLGVNEAHLPENVQSEAARGQRICWRTPDRAAGFRGQDPTATCKVKGEASLSEIRGAGTRLRRAEPTPQPAARPRAATLTQPHSPRRRGPGRFPGFCPAPRQPRPPPACAPAPRTPHARLPAGLRAHARLAAPAP